MAYASGQKTGLRFDRQAIGERQRFVVTCRGLEYSGEVVVADAVDPDLGRPLEGAVCFRVVFYLVPRRIPVSQIRDPRIAKVVPRRSADPAGESLSREVQAIREARERYVAGGDAESVAMRGTMAEREKQLQAEVAHRQALNYSQGRVYTKGGIILRPADAFSEDDVEAWVRRIVEMVFDRSFPSLPFDFGAFPATLGAEGIEKVFKGIFQGDPEAAEAAAAYGPALGLSSAESPLVFDGGECPVLRTIDQTLALNGGEMPAEDLLAILRSEHGLNLALSTLYLLAFVYRSRPGVDLRPAHPLQLRQGGPLLSDRITWDLLGDLAFSESLSGQLGTLRARPPLTWNVALPYASLMVDGLGMADDDAEIAAQEGRLLQALGDMGRRIDRPREDVGALAAVLEEGAEAQLSEMDKLQTLCSATGYRSFYAVAVDGFGGPSGLRQVLDLHRRLERLANLVPPITSVRAYLSEMTFGRTHGDLATRRDAVAATLGLDSLLGNPSLWGSVEASFQQLRREYAAVYARHHERYHQESVELLTKLERLRAQVDAIARFNQVHELGGPLATDVPDRFRDLIAAVRTCELSQDDLSLENAPVCDACRLPLSEDIPRQEAARVVRDTEGAMREYNRLLASEGARRILARPNKDQLDRLIDLVHVSDLTSLANVLDPEVTEFLRRFVRNE